MPAIKPKSSQDARSLFYHSVSSARARQKGCRPFRLRLRSPRSLRGRCEGEGGRGSPNLCGSCLKSDCPTPPYSAKCFVGPCAAWTVLASPRFRSRARSVCWAPSVPGGTARGRGAFVGAGHRSLTPAQRMATDDRRRRRHRCLCWWGRRERCERGGLPVPGGDAGHCAQRCPL